MNRPRSPKNRQCHHFLNLIATLRIHYSFLISLRPPKHCAKLFEQIKKTDDVHAFSRLSSSLVLARSLSLVFRVEVFIVVPQKPHQLRIAMRPAEIDRPVQCTKALHFFRCQLKVKHVEVLLHPMPASASKGDLAAQDCPAPTAPKPSASCRKASSRLAHPIAD